MARRRMIDPNFWSSEDIAKLNYRQRLLVVGLFSNADDEGKGKANPAYIRSAVFTYDDITLNEIAEDLKVISEFITIVFYEVEGSSYYKFTSWKKWQRVDKPQKSLIPDPFDDDSKNHSENGSENDSDSESELFQEPLSPKGKERNLNKRLVDSDECDLAFEEWYKDYPKAGSVRKKALESWKSLWKNKKINLHDLEVGTKAYLEYQMRNKYSVCGAQVFLNQERWKDTWETAGKTSSRTPHQLPLHIVSKEEEDEHARIVERIRQQNAERNRRTSRNLSVVSADVQ